MSKAQAGVVHPAADGNGWIEKRADATRGFHRATQKAAWEAVTSSEKAGGGELTVMGENGCIRSKDTIGRGHDPRVIRDREH